MKQKTIEGVFLPLRATWGAFPSPDSVTRATLAAAAAFRTGLRSSSGNFAFAVARVVPRCRTHTVRRQGLALLLLPWLTDAALVGAVRCLAEWSPETCAHSFCVLCESRDNRGWVPAFVRLKLHHPTQSPVL